MSEADTRHTAEVLVGSLHALDVHFLSGAELPVHPLSGAQLLAELAEHEDARLRLAIIPLLLCHPELASSVQDVILKLTPAGSTTLTFFYTAAHLLQQQYDHELRRWLPQVGSLPNLFGEALGLSPVDPSDQQLARLAERHRTATDVAANWRGSYEHAARRLLRRFEAAARWRLSPTP